MSSQSARIVSLAFELSYDQLEAILSLKRAALPAETALAGFAEVLTEKVSSLEGRKSRVKYLLSGLNALAYNLMEWEYWSDAEFVLSELVRLSLTHKQAFFLYDARLRLAKCLNLLGRIRDFDNIKREIPAGTRFWMRNRFWYLEDV